MLLVTSLIFVFVATYGQREKNAMFKIRGGISVPFDSFGKNSGKLDYSGFTKIGSNFGAEAVYFYSQNVGIGGLLSYSSFKIDDIRLAGAYINSNIDYDTAFADVNPFKTIAAVFGFYFDFPITDYFALTMKMLAGSHIVQKPKGSVSVETKTGLNETFNETAVFDSQFALYTSAGFRVKPYYNWNVTFEVEYVGSNLEFDYKINGTPTLTKAEVKTLVLSFGIAYFLN